jgi:biopolymer transport protein TolQ
MNGSVNQSDHGATASRSSKVLQAVERASKRSAAAVHQEMKQGVNGLATIASVAPWIGIFGTLVGIVGLFGGVDGEKSAILGALAARLSESIWPTALGILVGLTAFFCYRYLMGRLETIDHEMDNASLALLNQLSSSSGLYTPAGAMDRAACCSPFR